MVTSVVIAAHNEAAVLGRCLRGLLAHAEPGEFDVVVVANGCTDTTAEIARSFPGVRVVELERADKAAALNVGDSVADGFPRIYLDADIVLTAEDARALAAALGRSGRPPLAAVPRRVLETTGRPLLVRAYYAVNGRLPAFRDALFGRGAIAVSAAGRARFARFPDQFADDLFLDSLFAPDQKAEVPEVVTVIATPLRTRDLLRRLGRVRAGNAALREGGGGIRPSRPVSWLVDVVLPRPWLLPAGACYAALTLAAGLAGRRRTARSTWHRDESNRSAPLAPGPAGGSPRGGGDAA
jgi:glycosyltransferase involved in cell wall biosynthesis